MELPSDVAILGYKQVGFRNLPNAGSSPAEPTLPLLKTIILKNRSKSLKSSPPPLFHIDLIHSFIGTEFDDVTAAIDCAARHIFDGLSFAFFEL
jgi:hypothetical protein